MAEVTFTPEEIATFPQGPQGVPGPPGPKGDTGSVGSGTGLSGVVDVLAEYGPTSTGLQQAIDDAQALVSSDTAAPVLWLAPHEYRWTTPVEWKSANIVGAWPNQSVRVFWDGPAGATVLTKNGTLAGGGAFGELTGINFRPGTGIPATWVDLTQDGPDVGLRLKELHFLRCSGDAIRIPGWTNLHWEHLRFDGIEGFAIRATPLGGGLSSFVLDGFTYDNGLNGGLGFLMIDNTADATNLGTMKITNGRIELNSPWQGNKAIVEMKLRASPAAAQCLGLHISDVTFAASTASVGSCVLFRNTTNVTGSEALMLTNFRHSGLASICGGTWPPTMALPKLQPNYGFMAFNTGGGAKISLGSPGILAGAADPEGAAVAAVGSLYLRTTGGAATTLYVKTAGTGNTGWVAK